MLHLRSKLEQKRSEIDRLTNKIDRSIADPAAGKHSTGRRAPIKKLMATYGVLVAFVVAGCEELDPGAVGEQPVWFGYHYVNHAWGYQENGWLIDGNGNIHYFTEPEEYRTAEPGKYLSREDLEYNLAQADSTGESVDPAELEARIQLIPGAATGEITALKNIAADAGTSVLCAYLYHPEKDSFQYVFLGRSGDWEQFNLSDEADSLVDWLRGFGVFWISD